MNPLRRFAMSQMMKLIMTKWVEKPLYVITKLGIPDLLGDGTMKIDDIAASTETNPDALYRVMRALAAVKILKELPEKRFKLTMMGQTLRSEALASQAVMIHSDWHDVAWSNLLYSVKTGKSGFEKAYGKTAFEWLEENPRAATDVNAAHEAHMKVKYPAIVKAYDFSQFNRLVDVGGGKGELVCKLLSENANLSANVVDLPFVIEETKKNILQKKLETRCEAVASDIMQSVPCSGDLFILSHVLHDFADAECCKILENCRRSMEKDSKLIVIEFVIDAPRADVAGKLLDIEMLVISSGGRERTRDEFKALFEKSDLSLRKIYSTKAGVAVLELVPI